LSGGGTLTAEAGVLRTAPPRLRRYSDGLIKLSEPEQGNLGGTKGSTRCLLPVGVGGVEVDCSSEACSAPNAVDLVPAGTKQLIVSGLERGRGDQGCVTLLLITLRSAGRITGVLHLHASAYSIN